MIYELIKGFSNVLVHSFQVHSWRSVWLARLRFTTILWLCTHFLSLHANKEWRNSSRESFPLSRNIWWTQVLNIEQWFSWLLVFFSCRLPSGLNPVYHTRVPRASKWTFPVEKCSKMDLVFRFMSSNGLWEPHQVCFMSITLQSQLSGATAELPVAPPSKSYFTISLQSGCTDNCQCETAFFHRINPTHKSPEQN